MGENAKAGNSSQAKCLYNYLNCNYMAFDFHLVYQFNTFSFLRSYKLHDDKKLVITQWYIPTHSVLHMLYISLSTVICFVYLKFRLALGLCRPRVYIL